MASASDNSPEQSLFPSTTCHKTGIYLWAVGISSHFVAEYSPGKLGKILKRLLD
jgi:hypothetical protein